MSSALLHRLITRKEKQFRALALYGSFENCSPTLGFTQFELWAAFSCDDSIGLWAVWRIGFVDEIRRHFRHHFHWEETSLIVPFHFRDSFCLIPPSASQIHKKYIGLLVAMTSINGLCLFLLLWLGGNGRKIPKSLSDFNRIHIVPVLIVGIQER